MQKYITAAWITALITLAPSFIQSADSVPAVSVGQQLTLKQCVDLAVRQSERLQMSAQDVVQARERIRQGTGAILPNLKWNFNNIQQDTSGVNESSGGVSGTLTRKSRTESKFVVNQPLFAGLREFNARESYKADWRGFEKRYTRERIDLFGLTAEAFYAAVFMETARANIQTQIDLTQERVTELRQRVDLGKSRPSEVISDESQLASLKAQLAQNTGQVFLTRENLGFLIGLDMNGVVLIDDVAMPVQVSDEHDIPGIVSERSDIQALREAVISRRFALKVAKGAFFPVADVEGNYYTQRPGYQSDIDWDVMFNVDVPIFQGGVVASESREAKSQLHQAELELTRSMREATSEIRTARSNLNTSIEQLAFLREAFDKAKRSYGLQVKEYRTGLVNNLEVLAALNVMQNTKDQMDRAFLQSKLDWLRLQLAMEREL